MSKKAPSKAYRKAISLVELFQRWPNDAAAEAWFVERRWPEGVGCPHCGSLNVQTGTAHKSMPYRCREKECGKRFSTKTGTVMEGSKLGFQSWLIATYLLTTNLKDVSSMKLHRDLSINQRSAWFLAHRLRVALADRNAPLFTGPAEADEMFIGGKRKNMPNRKRKEMTGRGAVGKAAVTGVKDRKTNRVSARRMEATDTTALQRFVRDNVQPGAMLYTDEAAAHRGMPEFAHEAVNHSAKEYVRDMAHTNGMESF